MTRNELLDKKNENYQKSLLSCFGKCEIMFVCLLCNFGVECGKRQYRE